jgi:HemY protein
LAINPHLGWAARAVLAMQAGAGDWAAAEATIEACRKHRLLDADEANAKLAAVATARAMRLEESDPGAALEQALVAHKLAPALVPAAVIAGRLLAATGQERKAAKTLEKTWRLAPHPDVAEIYGAVYTGRSPRERLKRVKALVAKAPAAAEGPIAIARAAVEARDWDQAREALQPLADNVPSARVCALMAEIEFGEHADEGRARQWLASAMHAPRDPAWVADGHVSETWAPTSPATGELGAFEWKVPMDAIAAGAAARTPAIAARGAAEAEAEAEVQAEAADAEPQAAAPPPSDATAQEPVAEPVRAEAPADVPAEPAAVEEKPATPAKPVRRREEAAVFVPPRPPDDPGPEPREEETGNWFQTLFAR